MTALPPNHTGQEGPLQLPLVLPHPAQADSGDSVPQKAAVTSPGLRLSPVFTQFLPPPWGVGGEGLLGCCFSALALVVWDRIAPGVASRV